jgi:hypothetical protein
MAAAGVANVVEGEAFLAISFCEVTYVGIVQRRFECTS